MAKYTKTVPRNPVSCDDTLAVVLEMIIFQTADGDELVDYQIKPEKVLLTFEGEDG